MNLARIIVLVLAIGAGGVAALLAGRSEPPPPPVQVQVPAKLDTVDVLVARADIGVGHSIGGQDVQWQAWPAAAMNRSPLAAGCVIARTCRSATSRTSTTPK